MTAKTLELLTEVRAATRTGFAVDLRRSADLSQSDLARAAGIHPATVSRWESGARKPTGKAALRYARVLRALERAVSPPTADDASTQSESPADRARGSREGTIDVEPYHPA